MDFYNINFKTLSGELISMSKYKNKVLLIVNTASKCGFTPQYKDLEELYQKYKSKGLEILAFPSNQFLNQEPGDRASIENTCYINYGVTFSVFEKSDVKGKNINPVFKYLTDNKSGFVTKTIKWNFTKFLLDQNARVVKRFAPSTKVKSIEKYIDNLL